MNIPKWIINLGICCAILLACFMAWKDQNDSRESAEMDNRYKQARIDRLLEFLKPKHAESNTPSFEVKSDNQTGGITAGIVNMSKPERHLTDAQKELIQYWATQLLPASTAIPVNSNESQEAKVFATEIVVTLKSANVQSNLMLPIPQLRPEVTGVFIGIRDQIPPTAQKLAEILNRANIKFAFAKMEPTFFSNDAVVLVVGAQP